MRKMLLLPLVALLVMAVVAPTAKAVTYSDWNPRVPRDFQDLYGGDVPNPGGEVPAVWPTAALDIWHNAPQIGDEERVILNANNVTDGVTGNQQIADGTLMALAYDLELIDMRLTVIGTGTNQTVLLELYYGGLGRNPLGNLPADGSGGRFEVWQDANVGANEDAVDELFDPDLDGAPGGDHIAPWYWDDRLGGTANPDVYPNVNDNLVVNGGDESLWLQGYFAPIAGATTPNTGQSYVKYELLNLTTGQGNLGNMNLVITGGAAAPELTAAGIVGANLYYPFNDAYDDGSTPSTYADEGNWQVISDDPLLLTLVAPATGQDYGLTIAGQSYSFDEDGIRISFNDSSSLYAIPEPATMSLLGMSLLGLAGAGLRRRKRK